MHSITFRETIIINHKCKFLCCLYFCLPHQYYTGPILGVSCISIKAAWKKCFLWIWKNVPFFLLRDSALFSKIWAVIDQIMLIHISQRQCKFYLMIVLVLGRSNDRLKVTKTFQLTNKISNEVSFNILE